LVLLATALGSVKFLDLPFVDDDMQASSEAALPPQAAPPLSAPLALPGSTAGPSKTAPQPEPHSNPPAQEALQPELRTGSAEATVAELEARPDTQPQQAASGEATPSLLAIVTTTEQQLRQTPPREVTTPSLLAESVTIHAGEPEPTATDETSPSLLETHGQQTEIVSETGIDEPTQTAVDAEQAPQWTEHQVASGDSLARIFDRQGLDARLLHRIVNSGKEAASLAQIRPGQTLRFQYDENNDLTALELQRSRVEYLRVAIADDEISAEQISKDVERQVGSAAGMIESSLFLDGQKAGLSDGLIMQLATIFGWDIDFALEIRAGDQFRVLYEEQYLEGEKLRDGPILAAEFTNRGKTYTAVRYESSDGEIGYFDADGHSKRRAFIRTPIKFARISSRYNPKRWHPVLKKWRSHKGVDYAAPRGTPIRATGDGRIVHRGTKGGYGRTVIVEHAGKYTTLYAHMSKYSKRAKRGNRVKQGQVIGYVGASGLASGPHLHYEFRVRGKHRDPLRVKLPKSLSLPKSEIAKFRKTTTPLLTQLAAIPAETMVASAEVTGTH
jgi:murein DD-endopeptidase MepM/ murein hydrolase activator NlpD